MWGLSFFVCSRRQTLRSAPQWNGSSSQQPSLQSQRQPVGPDVVPHANVRSHEQLTFPHEVRNLEVHNGDCGVVDHVVLFHVVKLGISYDLPLLLEGGGQSQEVAEFVHFVVSVLQNRTAGHSSSSETSVVGGGWPTTWHPETNLCHVFVEHIMEVWIRLFFLPPAVHVIVPGSKRHWRNTALHSYSSAILQSWNELEVFPTYAFPPWISGGNCSSLRLLAEAYSCDQSGNRTRHCLWHCGPHKWSTQAERKRKNFSKKKHFSQKKKKSFLNAYNFLCLRTENISINIDTARCCSTVHIVIMGNNKSQQGNKSEQPCNFVSRMTLGQTGQGNVSWWCVGSWTGGSHHQLLQKKEIVRKTQSQVHLRMQLETCKKSKSQVKRLVKSEKHNQHGPPFQTVYGMVGMRMCRSNLGSGREYWFPEKEPFDRWTWWSDALGESGQNTADRECETPTLFLKDKAKEKEDNCRSFYFMRYKNCLCVRTCFRVCCYHNIVRPGLEVLDIFPAVSKIVGHPDPIEIMQFWSTDRVHLWRKKKERMERCKMCLRSQRPADNNAG